MSKKVGIIISIALALLFTVLIVNTANKKYEQVNEKVEVLQVTEYVPAGAELNDSNTKKVELLKSAAAGLAQPEDIENKTTQVSMVKGQYIYKDALNTGKALRPGYVEVFVPVELHSSAYAMPGQLVNVHITDKDSKTAPMVLEGIRVLHCLDNQGGNVGAGGNELEKAVARKNEPATIGIEVPEDKAEIVVYAASVKAIYLTRQS